MSTRKTPGSTTAPTVLDDATTSKRDQVPIRFIIYPKHDDLFRAAAKKVNDGNLTGFVGDSLAAVARTIGLPGETAAIQAAPPTALLDDLTVLDPFGLTVLHLCGFLRRQEDPGKRPVPQSLKNELIQRIVTLLQALKAHAPTAPRGPRRPEASPELERLLATRASVERLSE